MQPLTFYSKSKSPWTPQEEEQLRREYLVWNHDVIRIAESHKRTPGTIAYRLKRIGLLLNHKEARGYDIYLSSPLYQEIVTELNQKNERFCRKCKQRYPSTSFDTTSQTCRECTGRRQMNVQVHLPDTSSIQTRLTNLEQKVDRLLELMTAVYEFEYT